MKSDVLIKLRGWLLAAGAALLAGCAGTYTLDNTVQSFSQIPSLAPPVTYRFDRLPSQQSPDQAQLEALADPALNAAGLRRDDASPRYAVQVSARSDRTLSPWSDPWMGGFGWGAWGWHRRWGMGFGGRVVDDPPWYHREVNVIVRDLGSNRVVYESRAISDGPYFDSARVFPAMFSAALQGFPNPPPGPRVVNIEVPN